MLFSQLISVGYVPSEWLNAVIVPVFIKVLLINCVTTDQSVLHVWLAKLWKEHCLT